MPNLSEGLRSLATYAALTCLAFASGGVLNAYSEVDELRAEALAAIQDLGAAIQDAKLQVTELNLTNQLARMPTIPTFPPQVPPGEQRGAAEVGGILTAIENATDDLGRAQDALAAGNYWEVDDAVNDGLAEFGPARVPAIEPLPIDPWNDILMPDSSKKWGLAAIGSAVVSVVASLDADGRVGFFRRHWPNVFK